MKKILLSMALVLLGLNAAMAQSSLIATLSHEGNVSLFYGYNAFVDAMAAADHGDVITLSSGLFAPTTITKAVTIRGAAMFDDAEKGVLKTQFNGDITIEIPDETNGKILSMGYLYMGHLYNKSRNLQSPKFQNLRVNEFVLSYYSSYDNGCMFDALMTNIYVNGTMSNNSPRGCSFTVVNSIINNISYTNNARQCNIINSIVVTRSSNYISSMKYINFKNCIFSNPSGVLDGTNSCDHCLAVVESGASDILANMIGTNWTVNSSNEIFYGGSEDYYVLTPTAAQTYLGTDGTQVGIWGGPMPWSITAENPTITRCQVASRSTADGKLSVEIEVAGVQ